MLRLEIVTPEAKTYSDDVDSVVIPGVEGELGVLPMHAPHIRNVKLSDAYHGAGTQSACESA